MYGRRSAIWVRTLLVVVVYAAAITWVHRLLIAPRFPHRALALALSFVAVQAAAIAIMAAVLFARRGIAERQRRRSRAIAADAHAAVSEHAAGNDRLRVLRALQQESARDVARALRAFLSATRGTMHDRVAALGRDLGVSDREPMLDGASGETLYDRILLSEELLPLAGTLAEEELPRALASDERDAIAALDMLLAWRRSLPVRGLDRALTHRSAEVRMRAFLAMPYVEPAHAERIADGLRDESPRVRVAAARAAGKLRYAPAIPALQEALRDEDREVALAASFALAAIPGGLALIQHEPVAFEAVEKAALGRLELA